MGFYRPLFSIAVEHGYFSDGLWRELDFTASPGTKKMADGAGLLLKKLENGLGVLCDEERWNALRLYAEDANGMLHFSFTVRAKDRGLANYTSPSIFRENAILCFGNGDDPGESGQSRLSKEESASEADFTGMDDLVSQGILSERDRRVPPDFVVLVRLKAGADGKWDERHFGIRFGARRSFWKYHLLGGVNRDSAFIVDLDSRIEFESCGEVLLPGNRLARVFMSKERLPVLEKSNYRFQLRERGNGSGKVLVKRLPVASELRLGREVIDGRTEIVLESYVNY